MTIITVSGEIIKDWYGGCRKGKQCKIFNLPSSIQCKKAGKLDGFAFLEIIVPIDLLEETKINIGDQVCITGELEVILDSIKTELSIFVYEIKLIEKTENIKKKLSKQHQHAVNKIAIEMKNELR